MYQELDMTEQERFKFSLHKNSLRYLHFDFLGFTHAILVKCSSWLGNFLLCANISRRAISCGYLNKFYKLLITIAGWNELRNTFYLQSSRMISGRIYTQPIIRLLVISYENELYLFTNILIIFQKGFSWLNNRQ